MEKNTILIIEDDADIRESIRIFLESDNYNVIEAENGKQGLEKIKENVSLVILDIMMPGISGIKTCEEIRKFSYVPILFLTAKSTESDKLVGLMAGGDDYLPKPFSYAELLGRIKSLLRRSWIYSQKMNFSESSKSDLMIVIDNIRLNANYNEVWVDEKVVDLSETEYRILRLLMQHPFKIFSAQNLYESIWNEPYFYSCNNTVMVHIRKLRLKIEKVPEKPEHIKTVWGKGYRYE